MNSVSRRVLFLAAVLIFGSTTSSLASEVPFTIEGGQIIIKAKIKGNVPVDAVVLTGSPYSYLHGDVVTRLKIPISYTNDGPVTGRNDKVLLFFELSDVVVGDEKPASLTIRNGSGGMPGTTLPKLSKAVGREIGLSLGVDFFKSKIVQFDFKRKIIRFLDAAPVDYKNPSPAGAGTAQSVHRMSATFKTFYGSSLSLPVISDLMLEGSKVKANLDTGSAYPFLLSPQTAKALSLSAPDKGGSKDTLLKSLKIGAAEFTDVPGLLLGKDSGPFENEPDYVAIIGIAVLQNLLVTFDWKKDMIVIQQ